MTGYFTTEELFDKNRELTLEFNNDYEIMEIPKEYTKELKTSSTLNQSKVVNSNPRENKLLVQSSKLPSMKEQPIEIGNIKNVGGLNPDTKEYNVKSEEFKKKLNNVYKNQIDLKNSIKSANTFVGNNSQNENTNLKNETKDNLHKSPLKKSLSPNKIPVMNKKTGGQEKKNLVDGKTGQIQTHLYSKYIMSYQMIIYLIQILIQLIHITTKITLN